MSKANGILPSNLRLILKNLSHNCYMEAMSKEKVPIIETKGVTKVFGDSKPAVSDLDLVVSAGFCFGLLGPNGAGKTTILRMVYGVVQPTRGVVRIFGKDVGQETRAVRARLGVLLQDNVMIENLTPRDNLHIFGRHHLIPEAMLSKRVDELLDFLELLQELQHLFVPRGHHRFSE